MSTSQLIIDDTNPNVVYSQPETGHHWTQHANNAALNKTLHLTRVRGATVRVKFEGTAIAVFGHLPDSEFTNPVSWYSIDNGPTKVYSPDLRTHRPQEQFFYSGDLDPGNHTLFITNEKGAAYFWIDYFSVSGHPTGDPSALTQHQAVHVSVIVGGLVGALAFVMFLSVGWYYYICRRRTRQQKQAYVDEPLLSGSSERNHTSVSSHAPYNIGSLSSITTPSSIFVKPAVANPYSNHPAIPPPRYSEIQPVVIRPPKSSPFDNTIHNK
ncbi:hypothetical protein FA15DRAFT_412091 [Coprinopsis marcescibilis]|uniref:Uncharacterized protein n=1 Tax=Coprinopsis marcescibilis TaxID=230819 RepID=A0A5C3KWM8_COPMA|nr:hypothetical protein FA15DRAFT_412091 [Coprinopsis marcescibilis]